MHVALSGCPGQFLINALQKRPQCLVISGPSGSGKSLVASALAARADQNFVTLNARQGTRSIISRLVRAGAFMAVIEEAFPGDAGAFRALTRESRLCVEHWGQEAYKVLNTISWIVVLNEEENTTCL